MIDMPRKPDPTTTKATLKALNCKANEAIFFGDSDVDVKTAKNAAAIGLLPARGATEVFESHWPSHRQQ